MVKKSKLLLALDAQQGRDYEAEKRRKQLKAGEKQRRLKEERKKERVQDGHEATSSQPTQPHKPHNGILKASKAVAAAPSNLAVDDNEDEWESEPEDDDDDDDDNDDDEAVVAAAATESEDEPESDVPLSDLDADDLEDTIPHQRLTINNGPALTASTKRITVAHPAMPFHFHNSLVSALPPSSDVVRDPNDDLTRELEFYRIAKDAVLQARTLLKKENVPFSRPSDYFAEMVKSDEHMGKIKKKMYDQAASKKASEEAKKLRDARKFGKAVQVAKEQERAKEKRDILDKIKELKRKRKGQPSENVTEADDLFQEISVETTKDRSGRDRNNRGRGDRRETGGGSGGPPSAKRQKRDAKFGYGGKKRFAKSGDAISSGDLSGFSTSRMKGRGDTRGGGRGGRRTAVTTTKRLGKSRRAAGRS